MNFLKVTIFQDDDILQVIPKLPSQTQIIVITFE